MWIFLPAIPLWLVSLWLAFTGWLYNIHAYAWYDSEKKRAASKVELPASTSDITVAERHDYEGRLEQLQRWLDQARGDLDQKDSKIKELEDLLKRSAAGNVIDISDVG